MFMGPLSEVLFVSYLRAHALEIAETTRNMSKESNLLAMRDGF